VRHRGDVAAASALKDVFGHRVLRVRQSLLLVRGRVNARASSSTAPLHGLCRVVGVESSHRITSDTFTLCVTAAARLPRQLRRRPGGSPQPLSFLRFATQRPPGDTPRGGHPPRRVRVPCPGRVNVAPAALPRGHSDDDSLATFATCSPNGGTALTSGRHHERGFQPVPSEGLQEAKEKREDDGARPELVGSSSLVSESGSRVRRTVFVLASPPIRSTGSSLRRAESALDRRRDRVCRRRARQAVACRDPRSGWPTCRCCGQSSHVSTVR
jgi:hypothetical protein